MVDRFGADAFRTYEMFMGAFDQPIPWSTNGVAGCRRFLDRVWRMQDMLVEGEDYRPETVTKVHQTIRKVSEDFEAMKFNTAIAAMMEYVNTLYAIGSVNRAEFKVLLQLLCPVAPHICEEMWANLGGEGLVCASAWPKYDPALCVEDTIELPVQVNGKVRARVTVPNDADSVAIQAAALADPKIAELLSGKTLRKCIVVPKKIVNLIIG